MVLVRGAVKSFVNKLGQCMPIQFDMFSKGDGMELSGPLLCALVVDNGSPRLVQALVSSHWLRHEFSISSIRLNLRSPEKIITPCLMADSFEIGRRVRFSAWC